MSLWHVVEEILHTSMPNYRIGEYSTVSLPRQNILCCTCSSPVTKTLIMCRCSICNKDCHSTATRSTRATLFDVGLPATLFDVGSHHKEDTVSPPPEVCPCKWIDTITTSCICVIKPNMHSIVNPTTTQLF